MKNEPEIIKMLKEEEKLGRLQSKIQGGYEGLKTVEESSEDTPDQTTGFFEGDVEPKAKIDDAARENTEEVLQDAIDRYRLIFDNVNDEIIYLDKHGKILEVNKRSVDIFGRKPEEIIGKNFARVGFFGVKELPNMLKFFREVISGKEIGLIKLEVKHKDGHKIPVEASIRLIKKNGKTEGIIGIIRDITERKKIEERLQESEEKFRDLFENANDLIQSVDINGRFIYVNKKWLRTLGYTEDEAKGLTLTDILRKDQISHCMEIFKKVCSGKSFEKIETVFVSKDGGEIYVEGNANARFKDGRFITTRGIFRNITERKKAEQRMSESEGKYYDLFENANDLIQSVKPDGSFLYVNRAWRETLGYSEDEISSLSIFDIIHPDSKEHCMEIFKRIMSGEYIRHLEASFVAKDGREIIVEGSIDCRFEDGKPTATRGIFRDVTERKKIELMLGERLKEFKCLYSVTNSIRSEKSLEETLVDTTNYIKDAWQYPDITRSRIKLDSKIYEGIKFEETKFKQTADIIVGGKTRGVVEVYYLEEMPESDEGSFLKEERKLLDEIGSYLGTYVEKIEREEKLNEEINQLEQYKKLTVGRELKMRELKKRIKELEGGVKK